MSYVDQKYQEEGEEFMKQDWESRLVGTSARIQLDDLALLSAFAKRFNESRNSIIASLLHSALQDEIQQLSESDYVTVANLANEEAKVLQEKNGIALKDHSMMGVVRNFIEKPKEETK